MKQKIWVYSLLLMSSIVMLGHIAVPVGTGELFDKITILAIKIERFNDPEKRKNVEHEHQVLIDVVDQNITGTVRDELESIAKKLLETNKILWDIEDNIREKEAKKEFDDEFVTLARSVYINNAERCRLKRVINEASKSDIIEEKEYTEY